jgi:hypothetical protein
MARVIKQMNKTLKSSSSYGSLSISPLFRPTPVSAKNPICMVIFESCRALSSTLERLHQTQVRNASGFLIGAIHGYQDLPCVLAYTRRMNIPTLIYLEGPEGPFDMRFRCSQPCRLMLGASKCRVPKGCDLPKLMKLQGKKHCFSRN